MTNTQVEPKEYGIEPAKATELVGNLPKIKEERNILESQYNDVIKMDIESLETSKIAKNLRLLIRDNRTKGIEVWHKTTKDFFLKGGQFVDAIKRMEVAVNSRMEDGLEEIEKHQERLEAKRVETIKIGRTEILNPYIDFVPSNLDLSAMSEDDFVRLLNGARLQMNEAQENERKETEARIQKEKEESAKRETIRIEYEALKKQNEIDQKERERLEAIRIAADKKQREEQNAKLEAERKERERLENQEKDRIAKEAKDNADKEALNQLELSKGDSAKVLDLVNDLKGLKDKYSFKSKANQKMYADTGMLIDKVINHIQK